MIMLRNGLRRTRQMKDGGSDLSSKNYVKGRAFEYRVRNYFLKKGYYVLRAYASKGIYDLLAVPPNHEEVKDRWTLGIQCKTNGYLPPKERERFSEVIDKWCIWPVLAFKDEKKQLRFKDLRTQEMLVI